MTSSCEVSFVSPTSMNSATDSFHMNDEALMKLQECLEEVVESFQETGNEATVTEVDVNPACEIHENFNHNFPQIDVLRLEITKESETLAGLIDSCNNLLNSAKQEKSGTMDCRDELLGKMEETFSSAEEELNHLEALMDEMKTRIGPGDEEARKLDDNRGLMRDALMNAVNEWEVYLQMEIQETEAYYDGLIKERADKDKELSDWAAATCSFMLNLPGGREQRLQEIERILTEMDKKEQTLKWIQEVDLILQADQIPTAVEGDDELTPSSSSILVQAWNELQQLVLNMKRDLQDGGRPDHYQRESSASVKTVPPKSVKKLKMEPSRFSVRVQIRLGKASENTSVQHQQPKSGESSNLQIGEGFPKSDSSNTPGVNSVVPKRKKVLLSRKKTSNLKHVTSAVRLPESKDAPSRPPLQQEGSSGGNDTRHGCHICLKTFTTQASVQSHIRTQHFGERPFKCQSCPKTFTSQANLQSHMPIHTGEKRYRCPTCSKTFSHSRTLNYHILIHSNAKPFKCPMCLKGFGQPGPLYAHIRTHVGERAFVCGQCNKEFFETSELTKHAKQCKQIHA